MAGPRPLRDASWPRGRPDLTEAERDKVNKANILTDFAIQALRAAAERNVLALLEFPEDLGKTAKGTPASIWRVPEMRELSSLGLVRGAIFQNRWAPVPYAKPTGLITDADVLVSTPGFHVGWPAFDSQGFYKGPLPMPDSSCEPLIGKDSSGRFKTQPTAADHPSMSLKLAAGLLESWLHRHWAPQKRGTSSTGEEAAQEIRSVTGTPDTEVSASSSVP